MKTEIENDQNNHKIEIIKKGRTLFKLQVMATMTEKTTKVLSLKHSFPKDFCWRTKL